MELFVLQCIHFLLNLLRYSTFLISKTEHDDVYLMYPNTNAWKIKSSPAEYSTMGYTDMGLPFNFQGSITKISAVLTFLRLIASLNISTTSSPSQSVALKPFVHPTRVP